MYSRQISEVPEKLIQHGKAQFGTFSSVSPKLDIKGMHAPYAGVPVPSFLSNLRIKSRLTYTFNMDQYIGMTEFYDFKVFGLMEVLFWDKTTGKRHSYHSLMPARRRFVPINTTKGLCACYQPGRRSKLFWEDNHNFFKCEFNLKGDKVRSSAKGKLISTRNDSVHSDFLFVIPSPTKSRCTATWLSTMTIKGSVVTFDKSQKADTVPFPKAENGVAMVSCNRSYYKFHTNHIFAKALGTIKLRSAEDSATKPGTKPAAKIEKKVFLNLTTSNIDAADDDNYNRNALIIDGDMTPLPPVVMTHPFGIKKDWIIQDTEGMVDLTFTPISVQSRVLNVIVMRTANTTIYGTFEGVLVSRDGEKINLKNFPGIVSRNMVRT